MILPLKSKRNQAEFFYEMYRLFCSKYPLPLEFSPDFKMDGDRRHQLALAFAVEEMKWYFEMFKMMGVAPYSEEHKAMYEAHFGI